MKFKHNLYRRLFVFSLSFQVEHVTWIKKEVWQTRIRILEPSVLDRTQAFGNTTQGRHTDFKNQRTFHPFKSTLAVKKKSPENPSSLHLEQVFDQVTLTLHRGDRAAPGAPQALLAELPGPPLKERAQLGSDSGLATELTAFLHCPLINISKWKPSEWFFTWILTENVTFANNSLCFLSLILKKTNKKTNQLFKIAVYTNNSI